jgi:hypothetical protein
MLRKIVILSLLFINITHYLQAQRYSRYSRGYDTEPQFIEFGLKAGFNFNLLAPAEDTWESRNRRIGIVTGIFAQINFDDFFIQPELLLSQKGGKLRALVIGEDGVERFEDLRRSISMVDIPVLAGIRLFRVIRLKAGPSFSFPSGGKQNKLDDNNEYANSLRSFVITYQAGIGVDIRHTRIDFRYIGNFTKIGRSLPSSGIRTDDRLDTFQITFGYQLF